MPLPPREALPAVAAVATLYILAFPCIGQNHGRGLAALRAAKLRERGQIERGHVADARRKEIVNVWHGGLS